jgi:hypothetical protein
VDFHAAIEELKDLHQPVDREAVQVNTSDARKLRSGGATALFGLMHRQAFFVEDADNLRGQQSLGLLDVGVG